MRRGLLALAVGSGLLFVSETIAAEKPRVAAAHLGLGGHYKLGCWAPLRVTIEGGAEPAAVQVVAVTPDSDGVGVATLPPGGRPTAAEPGRLSKERLYVRVGQQNAPIEAQLQNGGRVVDRRVFNVEGGDPEAVAKGEELPLPTPSVGRLYLQLGTECGVQKAVETIRGDESWRNDLSTTVVTTAEDLPRDAIGYDSFDAVVIAAGAKSGGGWLSELTPDDARITALTDWVESGGRLVLSCGAAGAAVLGTGGPLAELAPGDYAGGDSLSVATAIERYAEALADDGSIDLREQALAVSRFENPRGSIEAYAGRSADETPLVIRTPRGFGEVTLVTFDLDAPALARWEGRGALLQKLLRLEARKEGNEPIYGWYNGEQDLVNALISRLDGAFSGVRTAPFLLIVGLVVLYLLLIGPGDYFFVKNVLKRVEATWITFPLLVIGTSAAAFAGAYWLKGDKLRVNQVEIVDVEAATGRLRGTLVTHLFSPRASRYDLALSAKSLAGVALPLERSSTAWLGKPGYGLGGMQSSNSSGAVGVRANYRINPTPHLGSPGDTIAGMPVQVWSTKTLISRYTAESPRRIDTTLSPDGQGLVEGSITNDTGAKLVDCRLLYGSWAWRLGDLGDGETVSVDESVSPVRIKTLLRKGQAGSHPFETTKAIGKLIESISVGAQVLDQDAAVNRYLHDLNLKRLLESGEALLLTRVAGEARSELLQAGEPLAEAESGEEAPRRRSWVFARFILEIGDG